MIGQVLNDRYEILDKIGEGGMAVTYRGRDRVLGRVVAAKVMRPELAADAEFLSRFRREARAAAGVVHEHVAAVYDSGSDGPYHYIVMEYVDGESLKERLRREGPLPLPEALRIASETTKALAAAHAVGVVHRDIKPHNIMLGADDRVKVTDFGLARAISTPAHTETGRIVGSVHYMSPEHARGEGIGPQSDLYSLGVTLFEMLTARRPFEGAERMALLHKHVYDQPPDASEYRPSLPPEVDSLIRHCLEKDLSARFASAGELLKYLEACPRTELPRSAGQRRLRRMLSRVTSSVSSERQRRARHALWAAALLLLAAASVTVVTLWASGRGRATMVTVPDVVGMGAGPARAYLRANDLGYREIGRRASEDVPEGGVLNQDPKALVQTPQGAVVKVVLSAGPSHVVVPDVTEMSVAQARRNLEAAGLATGTVQEAYHPRVPATYVASTLPAAGTRVVRDTVVDVIVSLGPESGTQPVGPFPTRPTPGGGREESVSFVVPDDVTSRRATVVVELVDDDGKRAIYRGELRPGEQVPLQKIVVDKPVVVRLLVEGQVRAERQYLP